MNSIIRTLVVDDQSLVRSGICSSLEGLSNIQVVGQAGTGKEALQQCAELKPDLVLLDFKLADMDAIELIPDLFKIIPKTKILIVTSSEDSFLISPLFACGVTGFFNKSSGHEELLKAIGLIYAGRTYICPRMARKTSFEWDQSLVNPFDLLSERELQVVLLISHGLTYEEICKKLMIAASTLKTYHMRVTDKLHIKNDVELILMATRYGLL